MEYKPDLREDDPKALFQQKIPESFLNLQGAIREKVAAYQQQSVRNSAKAIPIMDEKTFKSVVVKWICTCMQSFPCTPAKIRLNQYSC